MAIRLRVGGGDAGVTTVKTHVTSLMAKTGSPNRVRLALFARGV